MPTKYPQRLPSEFRVVDPDRGQSTPNQKVAAPLNQDQVIEREDERAGLRDLDTRLEQAQGLTRAQRDAQRILPRATPAEIPHPRMERELPAADALRPPLSGRQQKARRKASRRVQQMLPAAQYRALERVLDEQTGEWSRLNDALSESVGDVDALSDRDRQVVHRIDRAIQTAEKANDRGHVVYANVRMPASINRSNLAAWTANQYQAGDEFAFDRYTGAAHSLHEVTPLDDPAGRVAVLEIQTRRGIYLGGSEGTDDTAHLLPRGLQLRVVGTHQATYQNRVGERGTRIVIQMVDITPEPAERKS
jgi:hypothetical protein